MNKKPARRAGGEKQKRCDGTQTKKNMRQQKKGKTMKRVLLLGDSIRMGYDTKVKELLKDEYEVVYSGDNGRFAAYTLWQLNQYYKNEGKFDLVHWNNGYWDMNIEAPMKEAIHPLEEYLAVCGRLIRLMKQQLDSDLLYDFGFHKKDNDELIGSGGLTFNQQQGIWELGCNLRRDCWNQGYGTEAAAAILSFAENTLHIHRVMARHAKDNTASGRVLEKNGFSFVRECWDQKWSGSHRFECREYIWKSEKEEEKNSAARNEVERFYDDEYEEWDRLEWHTPEFEVTKRYMEEYIPNDTPQKILDIGGGPGRYSIFLAQKGHDVTLFDLSGKNIRQAIEKAQEADVLLDSCIHGDALRLSEYLYKAEQYDVVLLMGPLYHLMREQDREKALQEALRVLKPGGLLFASFISTYAPIQDYASGLYDFGDMDRLLAGLEDGTAQPGKNFTNSYFCGEKEAEDMMEKAGLCQLAFAGVENILCGKEELLHKLASQQQEKWLNLAWRLSQDRKLLGMSEHFLYIGRKQ